ncbi:hypothetical protein ACEWY4_013051 [Coilia grayii]|uniref:TNFR-Cys domain-containing protein n=1 Tax=Coilia grayii TaxID=363190 RepID=A0ABD1JV67_9TELE
MTSLIPCLIFLAILLLINSEGFEDHCNKDTHFYDEDRLICCKKCKPGFHLKTECSGDSETVCEACAVGTWSGYNYHENCFRCTNCPADKGLQYALSCSTTQNAKCVCQPGKFCIKYEQYGQSCKQCRAYKICPPGKVVIRPGTADSDVVCGNPDQPVKSPAPTQNRTTPGTTPGSTATNVPFTSSAAPQTQGLPLTTASPSTNSVLNSIAGATTTPTGTVAIIIVGCVVGLLVVVCVIAVFLLREKTGSSEKKAKIENGCAEAAIRPSPSESECQLLLNQNGVSDHSVTSSDKQTISALSNGLISDHLITSLDRQTSSAPSHGPTSGPAGVSSCYVNQDDLRVELPQTPTAHHVVNVNVNIMAPATVTPLCPAGASTPLLHEHPPQFDSELPLSQEEVQVSWQEDQGKEAHSAVAETGEFVC